MSNLGFSSVTNQVVKHLEERLRSGFWVGLMPGRDRLVAELGVSGKTVEIALNRLEGLGLLAPAEVGKRRRILVRPKSGKRVLRVAIIPYESVDRSASYLIDIQHSLIEAGHAVEFTTSSVLELGQSMKSLPGFVKKQKADAWILLGAPLEMLQWFEEKHIPAFAIFGRRRSVNLAGAGPDKIPVMRELVGKLYELGHRRMTFLVREERRKPYPGTMEQAFLDELAARGIKTSAYNLPDWDNTAVGFRQCLDNLFQITPPTVVILDEAYQFLVARQYLARHGLVAPQHLSLICCDPDPWFDWYWPSAAHISWDAAPIVRRVVRWVGSIAAGKDDRKQIDVKAVFVEGGTMGKVPKIQRRMRKPEGEIILSKSAENKF